jgi:hypothetical protein
MCRLRHRWVAVLSPTVERFNSLVNHYDSVLKLKLTEQDKNDLIGVFEIHLAGERPHESSVEPAQILYPFDR